MSTVMQAQLCLGEGPREEQAAGLGLVKAQKAPVAGQVAGQVTAGVIAQETAKLNAQVRAIRQQTPTLHLPEPTQVPDLASTRPTLREASRTALQRLARASSACIDDPTALRAQVLLARSEWAQPSAEAPSAPARNPATDAHPHDAYFRIERGSPDAYLPAVLQALQLYLQELTSDEEHSQRRDLAAALVDAWCAAVGVQVQAPAQDLRPGSGPGLRPLSDGAGATPSVHRPAQAVARAHTDPANEAQDRMPWAVEPTRRWIVGHQIFAVLSQALIATLAVFDLAMQRGDLRHAERQVLRIARLYRGSAAAFRFAASFDPAHYADVIRPSMSEPEVPAGFSGTLSTDHGQLVARLSRLREPLGRLREAAPEAHAEMVRALNHVYEDHKCVCARFDGATAPSLHTSARAGEATGIEMLERFQARRLTQLG